MKEKILRIFFMLLVAGAFGTGVSLVATAADNALQHHAGEVAHGHR